MGVASGCGEQEVGVASGSGWNIWVWLLGVVVRRYIDFLILLILLYLFFFTAASLLFVHFVKSFSFFIYINIMVIYDVDLTKSLFPHYYVCRVSFRRGQGGICSP